MSTTTPHAAPIPPATPPKKHRKWPWILGGLVILIIIIVAASQGGTTTNPTPHPTSAPAAPPATRPPTNSARTAVSATAAQAAPVVLYSKTGSGTGSSPTFTTGAEWQVQYTYDCTAFGQSGNFMVNSEDMQLTINQLGMTGADTDYVHNDPGSHSLSIDSECAWTIKVLG
jgi:hypothetical protein